MPVGLIFFGSTEGDVDVVFVLEVGVGFAGLARFWVAFAGELEGADGLFFVLGFLVGEADLEGRFGSCFSVNFALVVEDDRLLLLAEAAMAFGDGEVVGREAIDLAVAGDRFLPVGEFFVAPGNGPEVVAGVVAVDFEEVAVDFDRFVDLAFLEIHFSDRFLAGDLVVEFVVNAPGLVAFFSGDEPGSLSTAESVLDAKAFADFLIDHPGVAGASEGAVKFGDLVEEVLGELGTDECFGAEGGEELAAELEGGGPGLWLFEEMLDGFGGEVADLVKEGGTGVGGGEGLFTIREFLGKTMEFGEFVGRFDTGLFGGVGALHFEGELVEKREAFLHVLMESGVVEEVGAGADRDLVIGVFHDEKAEGLLGALDLAHGAVGVAHAIGGDGCFVGLWPVVDDRLEPIAQRCLWLLQVHHGVAPHQLGVGSAGALLVEGEEFLIFGESDFEVAAEEMLFGDLDLIAFHVAHLFEGRDLDLLHGGEGRVAKRGQCREDE